MMAFGAKTFAEKVSKDTKFCSVTLYHSMWQGVLRNPKNRYIFVGERKLGFC